MNGIIVIICAILPAVALVLYIYLKDKYQREPLGQIMKGMLYGVISALMAILVASGLSMIGLVPAEINSVNTAFGTAFFGAAIPEEMAKLLMLWLLLRHNKYYDEYVDGIVYAVCVGMGFAGFENILYLISADDWHSVAVSRAIFSVPGHYMFAVTMGYFYSMVHYGIHRKRNMWALFIFPVLFHGVFDALLMSGQVMSEWAAEMTIIAFLAFFVLVQKRVRKAIERQLVRDAEKQNETQGIIF